MSAASGPEWLEDRVGVRLGQRTLQNMAWKGEGKSCRVLVLMVLAIKISLLSFCREPQGASEGYSGKSLGVKAHFQMVNQLFPTSVITICNKERLDKGA